MIKGKRTDDVEAVEPIEQIEPVEEVRENREAKKPVVKKSVDVNEFIARQLKVINEWPDGAKKRAAAERILKNKEV